MRALVAVALVLLAAPTAQAGLLVTGFATNLPGTGDDDAFEITNTASVAVPLAGVTVSDGEGRVSFPPEASLGPAGSVIVVTNGTAYRSAARRNPDYAIQGAGATMRVTEGNFALSQRGDELFLEQDGTSVDVVAWGDSDYAGEGWAGPPLNATAAELRWFPRVAGHDSNTKADWEQPRQPRLGWRTGELPFALVSSGTAFTAPDQSRAIVSQALRLARQSLRLNVYEFRDVGLARDLLDHMDGRDGLDVRVLVDANPVGMDAEERLVRDGILRELEEAGAVVRLMGHARYAYDHAKYAVVDDRWLLLQSENLVPSAMPPDARDGNRGWGVLLDAPALARAMADVFDDDFELDPYGAREPEETIGVTPVPLPDFVSAAPRPRLDAVEAERFNATLVVGPEALLGADDPLLAALAAAREEILVEQLRIARTWRDSSGRDWPNDYLNALLEAARRGVRVRVLLDGHFLDDERDDNEATLGELERAGGLLPIQARLMRDSDDPVLHVKGLVIDRRVSWVGSMNWNLNSVAQNRETSVVLDAPEFAELFHEAFEADWDRADQPDATQTLVPFPAFGLVATVISAAALAARARRQR